MAVIKQRHRDLIDELLSLVNDGEKDTCRAIADDLLDLGYLPQKQTVRGYVLSFKSRRTGQTIAKIGALGDDDRGAFYSIKFYACKEPPQKFRKAVETAIETTNMQYKCCGCGVCGAAEEDRGYSYVSPDSDEFVRCGAYVVRIPDLGREDIEDFGGLLREQHQYFLSRIG